MPIAVRSRCARFISARELKIYLFIYFQHSFKTCKKNLWIICQFDRHLLYFAMRTRIVRTYRTDKFTVIKFIDFLCTHQIINETHALAVHRLSKTILNRTICYMSYDFFFNSYDPRLSQSYASFLRFGVKTITPTHKFL